MSSKGIRVKRNKRIFFSGIGGSGVSAIAGFEADRGMQVSGSDRLFDRDPDHHIRLHLQAKGISIFPQDGSGIGDAVDLAVFSTAVEKGNPDFVKAESLGVPVRYRPEYLAEIVTQFRTVAVAGTSGKSTVSGLLAFLMQRLGMEPNFIGGGRVKQFKKAGNPGNYFAGASEVLIIEACESDGSIVDYRPSYSLILNLDLDHHSIDETARMFERLSGNTSELVICGGDDKNLSSCSIGNAVRFSMNRKSEYRAEDIAYFPFSTRFSVNGQRYEMPLIGGHNVYNALACIAFLRELGVPSSDIAALLPEFSGIERRFDIHLSDGRRLVVDDYAHNPHKIFSLMRAMQGVSGRVCYVFQPHGFGPTRMMRDGYVSVFREALRNSDHLVLLPVYYAGGTAAKDISSEDITDEVARSGRSAETVKDRNEFLRMLPGTWDAYVVLGARDDSLSDFAADVAGRLRMLQPG